MCPSEPLYRDKIWLRKQLRMGYSPEEIAASVSVSRKTITNWMRQHGLHKQGASFSQKSGNLADGIKAVCSDWDIIDLEVMYYGFNGCRYFYAMRGEQDGVIVRGVWHEDDPPESVQWIPEGDFKDSGFQLPQEKPEWKPFTPYELCQGSIIMVSTYT